MTLFMQLVAYVRNRRDAALYADEGRPHLKIRRVRVPRFLDTDN